MRHRDYPRVRPDADGVRACVPRTSRARPRDGRRHPLEALALLALETGQVEVPRHVPVLAHDLVRVHHEVVRVEVAADVGVREEPRVRRVARALEAVELEAAHRVDVAELVGEQDPAARPRDPRELGDDELGPADVVEDAEAADEVEVAIREGERLGVPDDERASGGACSRAAARYSSEASTPTTSPTSGASAYASAPVPQPTSSARSSPLSGASSSAPAPRARRVARPGAPAALDLSITQRPPAWPARGDADPARELVGDRPRDARVGFERDAVADQRHRRSHLGGAGEPDGERVHRDRPDDRGRGRRRPGPPSR